MTTNGVFASIYSFPGTHGSNPASTLAVGPDGNLYGTTGGLSMEGSGGEIVSNTSIFRVTGLVPNPLSALSLSSVKYSGMNAILTGNNVGAGAMYVLTSSNLAAPLSQWTPVAVTNLTASGAFTLTVTNVVQPGIPAAWFCLSSTNN